MRGARRIFADLQRAGATFYFTKRAVLATARFSLFGRETCYEFILYSINVNYFVTFL
jgi:hypothetical protein